MNTFENTLDSMPFFFQRVPLFPRCGLVKPFFICSHKFWNELVWLLIFLLLPIVEILHVWTWGLWWSQDAFRGLCEVKTLSIIMPRLYLPLSLLFSWKCAGFSRGYMVCVGVIL